MNKGKDAQGRPASIDPAIEKRGRGRAAPGKEFSPNSRRENEMEKGHGRE